MSSPALCGFGMPFAHCLVLRPWQSLNHSGACSAYMLLAAAVGAATASVCVTIPFCSHVCQHYCPLLPLLRLLCICIHCLLGGRWGSSLRATVNLRKAVAALISLLGSSVRLGAAQKYETPLHKDSIHTDLGFVHDLSAADGREPEHGIHVVQPPLNPYIPSKRLCDSVTRGRGRRPEV
jgi:hypothetical protein